MLENATNLTNIASCVWVLRGLLLILPDSWQEWSAFAAIMTFVLAVIALLYRWPFQKKQHAHDVEMLKLQQEQPKVEAKGRLKRLLEKIISCWEDNKEYHLKTILDGYNFQKKLRELGNELKEIIKKDELLVSQTIVVEANSMVDATIDLATSLRPFDVIAGNGNLQIYQEAIAKGDKLVEQMRELIEKLDVKNE